MVVVKADGVRARDDRVRPGGPRGRSRLARGGHARGGAGAARGGDRGRLLAWLYGADDRPRTAGRRGRGRLRPVDRSRSPGSSAAAGIAERRARVHLKIDTGLSRNGATAGTGRRSAAPPRHAEQIGALEVVGVWSHLAAADEPGAASVADPAAARTRRVPGRADAGLTPACAT